MLKISGFGAWEMAYLVNQLPEKHEDIWANIQIPTAKQCAGVSPSKSSTENPGNQGEDGVGRL